MSLSIDEGGRRKGKGATEATSDGYTNRLFRMQVISGKSWLITSCRSANNIMPITFFLPAFIASSFYSA